MKQLAEILGKCLAVGALGILMAGLVFGVVLGSWALESWVLMWAWGLAVPALFPGMVVSGAVTPVLTFWQAGGIVILLNLVGGLFRSKKTIVQKEK